MTSTWRDFWNSQNSVYVSPRYKQAHFAKVISDLLQLLPSRRPLTLLDWGCGEALGAPQLVESDIDVLLFDPVPLPLEQVRQKFLQEKRIKVLTEGALTLLEEGSVDVVFINSVLQYMSQEEFQATLPMFKKLLAKNGVLLIGDIVPANALITDDVLSLLKIGVRYNFLFDVLAGLLRTFFSDYSSVRRKNGFTTYTEEGIIQMFARAGFCAERLRPNIGLTPHRMLIRALHA